ncbi:methionine--tRNA ligase subunit beta [Candidatus Pacearchaeota archaeon CG_4_9_14_0_2_um_filter_39_13]|nr:methionine--tRNA ligase subunit beta [Candidatus Pacearchaeota archaeon]PJC44683.1 MAG: methionine--tRNA ligase subunit beta [Candidatus Pacearchaeota archaeon CG_4_9_14_0_2_um_filter_39_13]
MTEIPIEDFRKLDIRVGTIVKVEDHPDADKLYVLIVDIGEDEDKLIVAGLKEHYKKEELEGKKAIFIVNLKGTKIRGVESEGMLLAAVSNDKKSVSILQPEKEMDEGTRIS